jgi:hypothetical protein
VAVVVSGLPLPPLVVVTIKGSVVAGATSVSRIAGVAAVMVSILVRQASMVSGHRPHLVPADGCGRGVGVGEAAAARGRLVLRVGVWQDSAASRLAGVGSLRASGRL